MNSFINRSFGNLLRVLTALLFGGVWFVFVLSPWLQILLLTFGLIMGAALPLAFQPETRGDKRRFISSLLQVLVGAVCTVLTTFVVGVNRGFRDWLRRVAWDDLYGHGPRLANRALFQQPDLISDSIIQTRAAKRLTKLFPLIDLNRSAPPNESLTRCLDSALLWMFPLM
jgi:hypothetical protein